jgi:integrase
MTVYKRGKMFYMNFTVSGQRIFKSTGKYTKKEAKQVEANERQKLLKESSLSPQESATKTLLSVAIDQVFQSRWKDNKDGTGTYARASKLVELMGNIPIGQINEDMVHKLIKKLDAKKVQPATVNRYLATLKTILKFKKQQWDFIKLRKERNSRIRVVTKIEQTTILELLRKAEQLGKKHYYIEAADMVEVLVDTGMRLSELLNLKYEDVNYTSNLISI